MLILLLACSPEKTDSDETEPVADSGDTFDDTGELIDTTDCMEEGEGLYEVKEGVGAPYWVSTVPGGEEPTATIVYLPGGGGSRGSARSGFLAFFGAHHDFVTRYRVLAPFSAQDTFPEEYERTLDIVAEARRCWGTGPVHLVGHSAGNAAAALMAADTSPWRSLSLAPGSFSSAVQGSDFDAMFAAHDLYIGVGELDTDWRAYSEGLAADLSGRGVDVTLDVWTGTGHVPEPDFDPALLHSVLDAR